MLGLLRGAVRTISGWMGTGQNVVKGFLFPNVRQTRPKEGDERAKERARREEELSSEGKLKRRTGNLGLLEGCV